MKYKFITLLILASTFVEGQDIIEFCHESNELEMDIYHVSSRWQDGEYLPSKFVVVIKEFPDSTIDKSPIPVLCELISSREHCINASLVLFHLTGRDFGSLALRNPSDFYIRSAIYCGVFHELWFDFCSGKVSD